MSQANKLADFEAVHSDVSSDYYSWLLGQAAALRSRRHDLLDWDKLAEELESMAVSEERELLSQFKRLFVHLLKLQYQARKRSRSWENSVDDARERVGDLLDWEKVAEEIESMAVREDRELLSQLKRLFVHLLKLQYQSRKRSRSWENSIDDARERVGDLLAAVSYTHLTLPTICSV